MKKIDIHDLLIDTLEQRLESKNIGKKLYYHPINNKIIYKKGKQIMGEIDLYAIRRHYTLFFEIKSMDTTKSWFKAYKQLKRIKDKYANRLCRNFYFYAYWNKDKTYTVEKVKL